MKRLVAVVCLLPSVLYGREPYKPDLGLDGPLSVWPLAEPSKALPSGLLPKRLEWTVAASGDIAVAARQVCQGDTFIRCESVNPQPVTGATDWGFRMYRKDTGAYLGTIDRNVVEEVQVDYSRARDVAEQHNPESMWIARKETEKAQLEYIAAACSGGAVYCTAMASKLQKFKELFTAACSVWSGVCITKVNEMKGDIQKRIDYVKQQCALNDQACFDAVTNGGESQERAQRAIEKNTQGGSGMRPPHTPSTAGRPPFMPGSGDADPMAWYDKSCQHCKLYDGKSAEDY